MSSHTGQDGRRDMAHPRPCDMQLRSGMSFNEWMTLGCRLARVSSVSAWALGDWLVFGQRTFGRRYRLALEKTNLDYQTLRNYAWVAGHVAPLRRRAGLSFQHHAEVASLPEPEQELWLRRAEAERWSRNELRRRLRAQRSPRRPAAPAPVVMRFEVDPEEERRWRRAAASKHLELQDWLRTVADAAARNELSIAGEPEPVSVEPRHLEAVPRAAGLAH